MDHKPRVDEAGLTGVSADGDSEKRFWHSRTPAERLRHVQYLRQTAYGPAADGPMERVLEIVKLEER